MCTYCMIQQNKVYSPLFFLQNLVAGDTHIILKVVWENLAGLEYEPVRWWIQFPIRCGTSPGPPWVPVPIPRSHRHSDRWRWTSHLFERGGGVGRERKKVQQRRKTWRKKRGYRRKVYLNFSKRNGSATMYERDPVTLVRGNRLARAAGRNETKNHKQHPFLPAARLFHSPRRGGTVELLFRARRYVRTNPVSISCPGVVAGSGSMPRLLDLPFFAREPYGSVEKLMSLREYASCVRRSRDNFRACGIGFPPCVNHYEYTEDYGIVRGSHNTRAMIVGQKLTWFPSHRIKNLHGHYDFFIFWQSKQLDHWQSLLPWHRSC